MMLRSLLVTTTLSLASLALAVEPAAAQPGLTAPTEADATEAEATNAPEGAGTAPDTHTNTDTDTATNRGVTQEDPRGDHGLLVHTALTQPKGTFTFHDRELVFPGLTYGISDRAQVSATVMAMPVALVVVGEAKMRLLDRGNFHFAIDSVFSSVNIPGEEGTALAGLFGATATQCFDRHCRTTLSASLMAGGIRLTSFPDDGINMIYASAGLATRLVPGVKALFEMQTFLVRETDDQFDDDEWERLLTLMAGVRLYNRRIVVDLGFMSAAERRSWGWQFIDGVTENILVPWGNFAYRWN